MLFSVSKGFAAMGLALLVDRGSLDLDAPVSLYWPEFGQAGKESVSVRTLLSHRAGLPYLDDEVTLDQCVDPSCKDVVLRALEQQRPAWSPGTKQGYHAVTFGLYARELFERVAREPMADFLRRELLGPLDSDVYLGAPSDLDGRTATLYPPRTPERVGRMVAAALLSPDSTEGRTTRAVLAPSSIARRALAVASMGAARGPSLRLTTRSPRESGVGVRDGERRRHRPCLPALRGAGVNTAADATWRRRPSSPSTGARAGPSGTLVLQKPVGWSQGFLKEERHLFCPQPRVVRPLGRGGYARLGRPRRPDQLRLRAQRQRLAHPLAPGRSPLCRALYDSPAVLDR